MKPVITRALEAIQRGNALNLSHVPDGFNALVLADLAKALAGQARGAAVLAHVSRDGQRMNLLAQALTFVAPDIETLMFPAWDCQPYDRVSPNSALVAQRMTTLARLARSKTSEERPRVLLTTVNAILQRVPAKLRVAGESFSAAPGNAVDTGQLTHWLEMNGYVRAGTVRDTGEYALRGGIVDLYPPGLAAPVRLDFFGDTLESIRAFDPETQRSTATLRSLDLVPMSEVKLVTESIRRFRQGYIAAFGTPVRGDALYETISEGRRYTGMEHWLPLFEDKLDTLFDYLPGTPLVLDSLTDDAAGERLGQIKDYHDARVTAQKQPLHSGPPYKPLPPDSLYLAPQEWAERIKAQACVRFFPAEAPKDYGTVALDMEGRAGRSFAAERADDGVNLFEAATQHIKTLQDQGKTVLVTAWSDGSRERLGHVLLDHGLDRQKIVFRLGDAYALPKDQAAFATWGLEHGFEAGDLAIIAEQDILGDRLVRQKRKARLPKDFLAEVAALSPGDLVVHVDHGIGRFIGLQTIEAAGAPRDCLELHYAGGDKLFLPVENIELVTRYGSEDTEVALDRLGGGSWATRKAKMRKRIFEMAGALMKIAAERVLREAPKFPLDDKAYEEFCARFPYDETEDQQAAIDAVLEDLASGRPMDRLICGDVGFGKTEVALRAAFSVAMNGGQVAVVVPTTLLARQHYRHFATRFHGLPINVAQASRFVSASDMKAVKQGLSDGTVDIVIGTHALLAKGVSFKNLSLIIVDEEQHFGVTHKERLKEMKAEVHVLTLSATPIPRTLQLAMSGLRELSLITTAPVDRLAVRSFVTPFDPLSIREALLRERYRGGQAFYVCPRIDDLDEVRQFLDAQVPEAKVGVAHGQMAAGQLDEVMTAFYDGQYDVLLATNIVESGLDVPNANTLIIHRADMFGLAQLYQLKGRVGRSKTRAYALFTYPAEKALTPQAVKRLEVLQSLEGLGAGFQLATHDLDIRGAGNLLGDEQSGHIKEVGYELYQQMLEEAVAQLKAGIDEPVEERWSPSITIGAPVTIPEHYVPDLSVRLGLYRRMADLDETQEIEAFAAELVDRFGEMPKEIKQLLQIVAIKAFCRKANIEKVEAGPKGVIIAFRDNAFANPNGLVAYVAEQKSFAKVRPDMKIVFIREMDTPDERLKTTSTILRNLVKIAGMKKAA